MSNPISTAVNPPRSATKNLRSIIAECTPLVVPGVRYHRFILRHAERIASLAVDAEALVATERFEATALIVRSMLESLFNIVASARLHDEFVCQKVLYEVRSWIRYAEKITSDPSGAVSVAIREMKQLEAEMLNEFQSTTTSFPQTNVWDCAVAAQHEDVYRETYFALSHHTHASTMGSLIRHSRVDEELIRNTVSYCVVIACAQLLVVFYPGNRPEKLVELEVLAAKFKQWLLGNKP